MEKGEGSNQFPNLNRPIDATAVKTIPPTFVQGESSRMLFPAAEEPKTFTNADDSARSAMISRLLTSRNAFINVPPPPHPPTADVAETSNAPGRKTRGRPKGSKNGTNKVKKLKKTERLIPSIPFIIGDLSRRDQENGNSDIVSKLMMRFDAVRRRMVQAGRINSEKKAVHETFKKFQLQTNTKKRVGSVPGVELGDIFYVWGEMSVVGLHTAPVGVEFIGAKDIKENSLAVCVVSTGKNADESDNPRTLIFTGFGGTEKFSGYASDQTLDRMNRSLEAAVKLKTVVRVVRTKKDLKRISRKIYIYDGLYMFVNMWEEKGENGFKVFKFKLRREPDQRPAFEIWNSVEQWRYGLIPRPGLLLPDLSNGAENLKVPLVNEVDDEKAPAFFTYVASLKQTVIHMPPVVECCTCQGRSCYSKNSNCACVERNGGRFPYVEGVLVTRGPIIYECGGSCSCTDNCRNKMILTGLKFSFEVFKTVDCGWGLRSWDPIRAGSFICEFAGEILLEKDDAQEDDFIFDTSRDFKSFQWNYDPVLVGEDASEKVPEKLHCPSTFMITGKKAGNVARFMNHSCSPNVFWQMIAREYKGLWCLHIGFFAMKHIPPLTELTYDYGASPGHVNKNKCLCKSENCSGSFG